MTKLSLCIASQCLTVDTDAPASITNIGRYQELTCKLNKSMSVYSQLRTYSEMLLNLLGNLMENYFIIIKA